MTACQTLPEGCWTFVSKAPPGDVKNARLEDIPQLADQSEKCFVIVDARGVIIFEIYKMAEKFYTVQAAGIFNPIAAFGCAIAILAK
jgi:hypothetical protein